MLAWLDKRIKWVFLLPAVIFVSVMMAFPITYTFRLSFFDWSMSSVTPPRWVGLENFSNLLHDERFWNSVKVTFHFTSLALVVETLLGVAIAILFFRKYRGVNVARTMLLLPMVATPVAMALVWMLMYEPTIGFANTFLKLLGMKPLLWLGSPDQVIPSLVIIDAWQSTPMIAIIVIAGLTGLPTEPYESAMIDGANGWQKFWRITLPLLRPTIMVAVILRLIEALKAFDIIYATTRGGPVSASETLNIYGYITIFQYYRMGAGSALLMLFFALVVGLTIVMIWMRKRLEED